MSDTLPPAAEVVARRKTESAITLAIGCALAGAGLWAGVVQAAPLSHFLLVFLFIFASQSAPVFLPRDPSRMLVRATASLLAMAAVLVAWRAAGGHDLPGSTATMVLGMGGGTFVGGQLDGRADSAVDRPTARVAVAAVLALGIVGFFLMARP